MCIRDSYKGVARAICNESFNEGEFPTITDGVRGMSFIETAILSHKKGNVWEAVDQNYNF